MLPYMLLCVSDKATGDRNPEGVMLLHSLFCVSQAGQWMFVQLELPGELKSAWTFPVNTVIRHFLSVAFLHPQKEFLLDTCLTAGQLWQSALSSFFRCCPPLTHLQQTNKQKHNEMKHKWRNRREIFVLLGFGQSQEQVQLVPCQLWNSSCCRWKYLACDWHLFCHNA